MRRPEDIATAVSPNNSKTATLELSLQDVEDAMGNFGLEEVELSSVDAGLEQITSVDHSLEEITAPAAQSPQVQMALNRCSQTTLNGSQGLTTTRYNVLVLFHERLAVDATKDWLHHRHDDVSTHCDDMLCELWERLGPWIDQQGDYDAIILRSAGHILTAIRVNHMISLHWHEAMYTHTIMPLFIEAHRSITRTATS